MRVLFFNYEYPPLGGGAANATSYILKEYSKISGLELDLITSSIDSEYHLEKIGENISIHRLPIGKNESNLHFQSEKDLMAYSLKAYFFSMKLIRRARKENRKYALSHSFFHHSVRVYFNAFEMAVQNSICCLAPRIGRSGL